MVARDSLLRRCLITKAIRNQLLKTFIILNQTAQSPQMMTHSDTETVTVSVGQVCVIQGIYFMYRHSVNICPH